MGEIKIQEGEFAKVGDVLCVLETGDKPSTAAIRRDGCGYCEIGDRPRSMTPRSETENPAIGLCPPPNGCSANTKFQQTRSNRPGLVDAC